MSSEAPQPNRTSSRSVYRLRPLLNQAIRESSIETLQSVLATARIEVPSYSDYLRQVLQITVFRGSVQLATYLLSEERVPVSNLSCTTVANVPSIELFKVLLAHGWDINSQDENPGSFQKGGRVIHWVLKNEEMVRWLLDHGARVDFEAEVDLELLIDWPVPILEDCAGIGSFSTFKLLMERGAKVTRRTLHRAVEEAASVGADPEQGGMERERVDEYTRQREMIVRYLVDELKLDVNQLDTDVNRGWLHFGTPINYAARRENGARVVEWLLEKGADPRIKCLEEPGIDAERYARMCGSEEVVELILRWKREHG